MISIETRGLTVHYRDKEAIKDITLKIEHPSFVTIMGPNGAGKTTFLKAIMGMIPYSGSVKIMGKAPKEARGFIGYLPQRERINTNVPLKVKEVVLMPLASKKFGLKKEYVERAKKVLEKVDMLDYWNHRFDALSGGQQQRVLFARTLITNPKVLILDEPFSATDVKTKSSLIELLHHLKSEKTILIVIHDINPLVECTDDVLLLNKKVLAFGLVKDVINEENLEQLYGTRIPIIREMDKCYVVGGDRHV